MITSYATLQTEVLNWLNRSDLTAEVKTFISLAEASMKRRLKTRHKTRYSLSFAADDGDIDLPTDNAGAYSLYITSPVAYAGQVDTCPPDKLFDNRRVNNGITGRPILGAVVGDELLISPIPDQTYSAELVYEGFSALSDSTTTNYVLTNYPDVYLYGALVHSAPFLVDDERIQVWERQFEKAMRELELAQERAEYPATPIAKAAVNLGPVSNELYGR